MKRVTEGLGDRRIGLRVSIHTRVKRVTELSRVKLWDDVVSIHTRVKRVTVRGITFNNTNVFQSTPA